LGLLLILSHSLTLLHGVQAGADDPEIIVELDRREIFLGETVQYTVLLNHFGSTARPALDDSDRVAVRLVQQTVANSSFYQSNGLREQRIVRQGPVFVYELRPLTAGAIQVPRASAETAGKQVHSQPLTLKVNEIAAQDLVLLDLEADRDRVYPTQAFRLRLTVAVKRLPDPVSDRDPLSIQGRLPELSVPWVNDEKLPAGLVPAVPWTRWLNDFVDRNGAGFSINGLQGRRDVFSELFDRDPFAIMRGDSMERNRDRRLPFHPPPSKRLRNDLKGQKVEYWEYTLERQLIGERSGTYQFGSATMKGTFGTGVNTRGELEGETVFATTGPLTVVVAEPPEIGRPESYTGAIGRFDLSMALAPQTARVGEPMTLTLTLQGEGTLTRALAPNLDHQTTVVENFRVHDATEETESDRRRFVYSVRPKHDGVTEFPSVELAYFDVDAEEYVSLRTDPVPVEIRPATQLNQDEIAAATGGRSGSTQLEVQQDGVFANVTDLRLLRDERVQTGPWFLSLGGMVGVFLLIVVTQEGWVRRQTDPVRRRRRRAERLAQESLAAAAISREAGQLRETAEHCSAALIGLVAAAAGQPEVGCAASDAVQFLEDLQVDAELLDQYREVLQQCDAARFGNTQVSVESLEEESRSICGRLQEVR
jgi:hypothetical protein